VVIFGKPTALQIITVLTSAPLLASEDAAALIVGTVLIPRISRTGLPAAIGPAPHRPPDGFAPESVLMSGYLRPVTSSVSVQGGCCGGNLAR
jgi:hypothetical protein